MIALTSAGRRRGTAVAIAAAVVIVLAVVLTLVLRPQRTAPAAAKIVAGPATKPRATTPAPTPTPKPRRSPVPHDFVAAAAPTSFSFRAPNYTIHAHVCGMEYVRPLDPPGEQHHTVCWVQHDFGFAPGSKARGTTYVLGHAWAEDPLEVLNKVSAQAMRQVLPMRAHNRSRLLAGVPVYPVTRLDGDAITLRTPTGVLTYTVRDAYAVAKEDAGNVAPLMDQSTRNRVVLITCGELHGVDYDYNVIVDAYLTSSKVQSKVQE